MKAESDGAWLEADWDVPRNVRAGVTTRLGGASRGCYRSFNLATHVGDDAADVEENRRRLQSLLGIAAPPCWLEQHHGNRVIELPGEPDRAADGAYTRTPGAVCAVLAADCIPLLLAARDGSEVAAVHAGWRGLTRNIIEAALDRFRAPPAQIRAWLGPHVCAVHYPVGADMRSACISSDPAAAAAFRPCSGDRWLADLGQMAALRLQRRGVTAIRRGPCTFADAHLYYSHRRDGNCGRMAALIWINEAAPARRHPA